MWLFRRGRQEPEATAETQSVGHDDANQDRWYVPSDNDLDRFKGADGLPALHLITYTDTFGETVLRLCEDSTGLLVGPTDRRLAAAGVYVSQLRGDAYHQAACRAGSFEPGAPVILKHELDNKFDQNAVTVYDATGTHLAAYVNKQKARTLPKLLAADQRLRAISLRGTPAGLPCDQVTILAAHPDAVTRRVEARPGSLPLPAYLR